MGRPAPEARRRNPQKERDDSHIATSWELTERFGGSQVVAGKWRAPLDEIHFTARIGYQGRTALVRGTR